MAQTKIPDSTGNRTLVIHPAATELSWLTPLNLYSALTCEHVFSVSLYNTTVMMCQIMAAQVAGIGNFANDSSFAVTCHHFHGECLFREPY
jgi:hypothetical protein